MYKTMHQVKASSNFICYIRSQVSGQSKPAIYFLKCISCNSAATYTDKSVDVCSSMSNHIASLRLVIYYGPT